MKKRIISVIFAASVLLSFGTVHGEAKTLLQGQSVLEGISIGKPLTESLINQSIIYQPFNYQLLSRGALENRTKVKQQTSSQPYQSFVANQDDRMVASMNNRSLKNQQVKEDMYINDLLTAPLLIRSSEVELTAKDIFAESEKISDTVEKLTDLPVVPRDNWEVTFYNSDCVFKDATATGNICTEGLTVAADPILVPYGTVLEITFPNGEKYIRRVDDTGGALRQAWRNKGRKVLDIYYDRTSSEIAEMGRIRNVTVKVIGKDYDFNP